MQSDTVTENYDHIIATAYTRMNCSAASELLQSTYPVMCIFKLLICCIGLITICYVSKTEGIAWLVHPNAKVLFVFHIFWTLVVTTSYFVVYVFEIIRVFKPTTSSCDILMSEKFAFWLRYPAALTSYCQAFAMLAFAIERAISTAFPNAYEKNTNPAVGVILGIFSGTTGGIISYLLLVSPNHYNNGLMVAASSKTIDNTHNYTIWLVLFVCIEVLIISIFVCCFHIAKFLLRRFRTEKEHRLSTKYQIRENLKLVNTLLPCFTINTVLNFLPTAIVALADEFFVLGLVDRILVVEYANQLPLYAVIMPLVMLLRNKQRRQNIRPETPRPSAHFDQLHIQWK